MMEWFRSGGFGMFLVLIFGAGSIGFGAKVLGKPTAAGIAQLRALPALVLASAVFAFGLNMWAVNRAVSDEAFLKAHNIALAEAPLTALIGFTESVQPFTLAGLLMLAVAVIRVLAEGKHARASAG
jgi:hypothetical protein